MRRKDSYYTALRAEFEKFLTTLENPELFLLKSGIATRKFKGYLKERETDKKIPSLLKYYGIEI